MAKKRKLLVIRVLKKDKSCLLETLGECVLVRIVTPEDSTPRPVLSVSATVELTYE